MKFGQIVLLCATFTLVVAHIKKYTKDKVIPGEIKFARSPLYVEAESPTIPFFQNHPSYIDVQLTFSRQAAPQDQPGRVEVVIAHSSLNPIDRAKTQHCCSMEILGTPGCMSVDRVGSLVLVENPNIFLAEVVFNHGLDHINVHQRLNITATGQHYLYFVSCLATTGVVYIDGEVAWVNPPGYINAESIKEYQFAMICAVGYFVFGVVWKYFNQKHQENVSTIQHYITIVICLGVIENILWIIGWTILNKHGDFSLGLFFVCAAVSGIRRTAFRLLLMILCMGYGVIKRVLLMKQKVLLAVVWVLSFLSVVLFDVTRRVSFGFQSYVNASGILAGGLDIFLLCWCCLELSVTMKKLKQFNQNDYQTLYKWFSRAIAGIAYLYGVWSVIEVVVFANTRDDDLWYWKAVPEMASNAANFMFLVVAAYLWRPNWDIKVPLLVPFNPFHSSIPVSERYSEVELEFAPLQENNRRRKSADRRWRIDQD